MCLQQAGMSKVPNASLLECFTGMPFGTTFFNFAVPMFFPNAAQTDPHQGLSQALTTLGWTCELWQGDDATTAKAELEAALRYGPVLLGPIDMSFLRYDPNHENKKGADHFVVVLNIKDEVVQLHDPQFYPYALLPMDELMQAWNADAIGYINKTYTMRHHFREQHKFSHRQILKTAFKIAQKFQMDALAGPVVYGGKAAFNQAVKQLEQSPNPAFIGLLMHFALPIGARRSTDAMQFMKNLGKSELTELYKTKATLFGSAQYYAVTDDWSKVVDLFHKLGAVEENLAECLRS